MTFEQAMEPLYSYVDGLDDIGRDRIVTGLLWRPIAHIWKSDGARCLVGHVANVQASGVDTWVAFDGDEGATVDVPTTIDPFVGTCRVHVHFDMACDYFGTDRVVAALKARAGHAPPLSPSEEPQAVEVGR